MANILITGCNGQLGTELQNLSSSFPQHQFFFTDVDDLDITSLPQVEQFVANNKINYLINCAAYTNVDAAEDEEKTARLLNCTAVENLGTVASGYGIIPIHISTDYVFSGENHKPYVETDVTKPPGVYGATKLEGEIALQSTCSKHIIVRTSWLYSPFGKNFLKTMLNLGQEKQELSVVNDQIGSPTYACDLACALLRIVEKIEKNPEADLFGTYHFSNEGVCSWYDFATEIQTCANNNCTIKAISSKDFPTKAKRPFYSVLNKSKIKRVFELEVPHWKSRIDDCIKRIKNS